MSQKYELHAVAGSVAPLAERGQTLLDRLRRVVPFDAAWLALTDPLDRGYSTVGSSDLNEATLRYLAGPKMARDIDITGTNRRQPPLSPSDLPYPHQELDTWSECLIPGGYHEALAVALFGEGGRHVGFMALLYGGKQPPPTAMRRRLQRLLPALARGVDPLRSLATVARVVRGGCAGRVLCANGGTAPLPGLDGDPLLVSDSPIVAVARRRLQEGQLLTSFLWSREAGEAAGEHVRATVLAATDDAPGHVLGAVILSPPPDLHGLTARELEVLGLVVDGCSNQMIARQLFVSPRTVAAHLEHILIKLNAPTRTLAAVRAERLGLYVPPAISMCGP